LIVCCLTSRNNVFNAYSGQKQVEQWKKIHRNEGENGTTEAKLGQECNLSIKTDGVLVMVFNITINNISVISWQSVLLVEVPRENH